ncbi:ABC transporter substrate-binding protein [Clostridium ganghwense]|uniref:ABC transporter substrate-binding protein n=1 Tax=Clostridium ganghwense TaxID=312089 RepID=A0ABT4CLV7_9CLOT|nr:ABC transporter substrate-binding protein [Clostridium ganghwense]MCY6370026.1 ABC transporter substrate-binding protein [Clostridium ganghwense]
MKKKRFILIGIFLVVIALFYVNHNKPIKIAILNDFEKERSEYTTSTFLSAQIAQEEINEHGGINNRKIELMIKDTDFNDLDSIFKSLKSEKVEVIISAANSQQLIKLEPYLEKYKITCIAVNSTSVTFSNKKDYIWRVLPDDSIEIKALFDYLKRNNIGNNFAIIYDTNNLEYKDSVEGQILNLGGKILWKQALKGEAAKFSPNNIDLIKKCDLVLLLAYGKDSAFIIQNMKRKNIDKECFGLSWAADYNLIYYGGKAVEGFTFFSPKDISNRYYNYNNLIENLKKYDKNNSIISIVTYEALYLISKAYENKNKYNISFQEGLMKEKNLKLHNNTLQFNYFGDCINGEFIFKVKEGKFIKLEDN